MGRYFSTRFIALCAGFWKDTVLGRCTKDTGEAAPLPKVLELEIGIQLIERRDHSKAGFFVLGWTGT